MAGDDVAGAPARPRERAEACAGAAEAVQVGTLVMTVVPGAPGPAYEVVFAPEGGPRTRLPAVRCEGPRALLRLLAALLGDGFWPVEALEELRREGATRLRGLAVAEARLRRAGLWPAGDPTSRD